MPSFKCCLFNKRSGGSHTRSVFPHIEQVSDVCLKCGRCGSSLTIPDKAIVFVCSSCRCVNRVTWDENSLQRITNVIDCNIGECVMLPNNPSLFQLGDTSTSQGDTNSAIPVCSVCLDGIGDMVLEPCQHGGICEDCAKHIALNKAVGGSHCPKCRQDISYILRIGEIQDDYIKAQHCDLPEVPRTKPPRVPPPIGHRKAKELLPSIEIINND